MSIEAVVNVFANSKSEHDGRLVLITLANFCGPDGRGPGPDLARVALETRLTVREVKTALRELRRIAELEIYGRSYVLKIGASVRPNRVRPPKAKPPAGANGAAEIRKIEGG